MDDLHDALEAGGYNGHNWNVSWCASSSVCLPRHRHLRAEAFRLYIEDRTKPDGSDLGLHLARLFDVLNTPAEKRQKNLDETLAAFPYVNGELFAERLGFADFNRDMRNSLLACTRFDWSCISPEVVGGVVAVQHPTSHRPGLARAFLASRVLDTVKWPRDEVRCSIGGTAARRPWRGSAGGRMR